MKYLSPQRTKIYSPKERYQRPAQQQALDSSVYSVTHDLVQLAHSFKFPKLQFIYLFNSFNNTYDTYPWDVSEKQI